MKIICIILFYPTLILNRFRIHFFKLHAWWTWIDDQVAFGAFPSSSEIDLLKSEGVQSIISLCSEQHGHIEMYKNRGIEYLYLPTRDYQIPSVENLHKGVQFISARVGEGKKVYVHCKAGRGRSAALVLCYLISKGMSKTCAQNFLLQKRASVSRKLHSAPNIIRFEEEYLNNNNDLIP